MNILKKAIHLILGEENDSGCGKTAYRVYSAISFVMMLAAIFAVFYYIFTNPQTDSDYVENVIWAQASIDSGRILSDTFYYGYAMPIGGNLFMLPFVAALGPTLTANRLGIALFFCAALFALVVLARGVCKRNADAYSFITISLLAMFTVCGSNLLHHILYYGAAYCVTMGLMGCTIPFLKGIASGKKVIKWYVGLALWSFWGAANGFVQMALCTFPAVGAMILSIFTKPNKIFSRDNLNDFKPIAAIVLASAAGFIFL